MVQCDVGVDREGGWRDERRCGFATRRRRGLARALMLHVLADAWHKGARTASLQSTRTGRPLYAGLGFRPVGRYEEWVASNHIDA